MRLSLPGRFVVCCLLLALAPSVWAQMQIINAVGVVVADGPQSAPLRGAGVSIVGIGSTITTQSGQFSIPINALMIGEKLTFQITMPGWHLVSPQSAETIMPRDPLQHPFRFTMVRDPAASSLTGNLGPGIYLSHLVGQLGNERGSTTASVWLSAAGPETYIVDSINIAHHPGPATSVGSGADKPDAVYSFRFRSGSNETCLLNPALRLDKQDRREVWFSLGLAPRGTFSTSGGEVAVSLNYHVEGHPAIAGTLPLWSPPNDAVLLSKLLHRDIEILAERDARAISLQNRAFGSPHNVSLGNAADSGCEEAGQPISSSRDGIRVLPLVVKGDDESGGKAVGIPLVHRS